MAAFRERTPCSVEKHRRAAGPAGGDSKGVTNKEPGTTLGKQPQRRRTATMSSYARLFLHKCGGVGHRGGGGGGGGGRAQVPIYGRIEICARAPLNMSACPVALHSTEISLCEPRIPDASPDPNPGFLVPGFTV